MKHPNIFDWIRVDEYAATPKYLQLTNSILKAIETGKISRNDLMPSINELSYELEISRDTAEKGYKYLKKMGVLGSVPGKGYFIQNTDFHQTLRIFLLFNKLSAHKKILYDALIASLGEYAVVDFYIYNNDFGLFKKLLTGRKEDYSHYVIIPHLAGDSEEFMDVLKLIPPEKLILLDKSVDELSPVCSTIYEQFDRDLYGALKSALHRLLKYDSIKIIFPEYTYHPKEILSGFSKFCCDYGFNYAVVTELEMEVIEDKCVYISLMEDDLVTLIEKIIDSKLKIGKDVGVISYNETALKKIILDGITTVSTDFRLMGRSAAELILRRAQGHLAVPFHLNLRNSL